MALTTTSGTVEVTIPVLDGIPAKRRSLGQLQGNFERQISILESDCHLADPNMDGTHAHSNTSMQEILNESADKLRISYTKWSLRFDQLLEEDTNEANVKEYKDKWKEVSEKYTNAKTLVVRTFTNIKKSTAPQQGPPLQHRNDSDQIFRPVNELKPDPLGKESTPGQFLEWKRRFKSFFLASNLARADILTQQEYFRGSISSELARLLDSIMEDTLPVFPDPLTPNDKSCCMQLLQNELERRFPLTLCRLDLFTVKQGENETFTDFISKLKKKSETADISNFSADSILSYIVLAGCNDQNILEEVLKLSKTPDFESICKVGTNLEVARSIMGALPGIKSPAHNNHLYKITAKKQNNHQLESRYARDHRKQQSSHSKALQKLRDSGCCTRCGQASHKNKEDCPVKKGSLCHNCGRKNHWKFACVFDSHDKDDSDSESESETSENEPENSENESENLETESENSENKSESCEDSDNEDRAQSPISKISQNYYDE